MTVEQKEKLKKLLTLNNWERCPVCDHDHLAFVDKEDQEKSVNELIAKIEEITK